MTNSVADPAGDLFATQLVSGVNYPFGAVCIVNVDGSVTQINSSSPLPVTGNVAVSNFPSGFTVGGTVAVSNLPSSQAVTGTFWQTTQPVSVASLPLPSGAATAALQPALNGDGGALSHITNFPSSQAVTGTFWQATQPVSGSVTANAGTNLNTSALALEAGNIATVATNTANGTPITGTSLPAGGVGRFGWLSAIYSAIVAQLPAGTNLIGKVGIDQTTPGTTNGVQLPVNQVLGGGGTAKIQASNVVGTASTVMTTELNTLANNASLVSSVAGTSGVISPITQPSLLVELYVTFGTGPTTGNIQIWFLKTLDNGTTFEDGSSSITPTRTPDISLGPNAITTGQRLQKICDSPLTAFKILVKNNGTAQAFAASGNVLRILPFTRQNA